ncbi:MAG: type II toxin-antitoxin system RelE/ParE family toxin [Methyloceanibacter sp.]|jgi:phage-related protein
MTAKLPTARKPAEFVGSALDDLSLFPNEVKTVMGYAIHIAQIGGIHPNAKPLKGFGGAGVLEISDDHDGDTYRAVYTVKFASVVYVLHAFQKKSKKGIAMPKADRDLIESRLRVAKDHYKRTYASKKTASKKTG